MTQIGKIHPLTDQELAAHEELLARCRQSSREARGVVAKSIDALKDFRMAIEKARTIKAYAKRRGVEMGWKQTEF